MGCVLCPKMICQINIKEAPLAADLGAGNLAGLRPGLQRVRVQTEKGGGFDEVERAHHRIQ